MLTFRSSASQRGQWSVIGSLISIAILITLAAIFIPRLLKPAKTTNEEASAIQRADGTACTMYQSQMNQAVSMYKSDNDGAAPTSMDQLKKYGVTDDMIHAPGCTFVIGPHGRVTDAGQGRGIPTTAPASGAPAPSTAPASGQRGPGGVTIPTIPGSGSQSGGDVGE
jgi:type II secretory pathway pseudopilin PulG